MGPSACCYAELMDRRASGDADVEGAGALHPFWTSR